jgi:hypothetical protein
LAFLAVDFFPDRALASSSTLVLVGVERLKSSLVAAGWKHAGDDSLGQIAAVGVAADLLSRAEDMQRGLALEDFLDQVGDDVAHGQLDVAAGDVLVAQGAALADADAIERPADRVREACIAPRRPWRNIRRRAFESHRCWTAAGRRL